MHIQRLSGQPGFFGIYDDSKILASASSFYKAFQVARDLIQSNIVLTREVKRFLDFEKMVVVDDGEELEDI